MKRDAHGNIVDTEIREEYLKRTHPSVIEEERRAAESAPVAPLAREIFQALAASSPSSTEKFQPALAKWRCRNPECPDGRPLLDVSEESHAMRQAADRELARRGEPPLDVYTIMICGRCRVLLDKARAERARDRHGKIAEMIRELKTFKASGEREREILKQLEKWGHPDVSGLVASLSERRARKGGNPKL